MAFWGVYVKPKEPYILKPDCDGRRLRVAQATLGEPCEVETARTVLQCAVGNKPPISVCSLSMKELSCCPLNLEFEECEDVFFSVVGPCGVYLAGCFMAQCASSTTSSDGVGGSMTYHGGKTSEDAKNLEDKKLSTTEEAKNEKGRTFTTEEAENVEEKKLITTGEAEIGKDKDITTIKVLEKEKDKMLSAIEEDIGDTDSFADDSLYDSEENTYDLNDSFIDDSDLPVQPSMQELLGVEVNEMMVENEQPKNRMSSSKRLKRNQSIESDGDTGSKRKRQTTKNSSSEIDGGADYKRGSGGNKVKKKKKKQRTLKNSSSGVGGADFKGGSGGTLGRGEKGTMLSMPRENLNKVIESNGGQAPFKFRLGDEEIIKAWNVGVEGMHVGDKRRLILPPSMGSWRRDESAIPTNSYLIYDIEC